LLLLEWLDIAERWFDLYGAVMWTSISQRTQIVRHVAKFPDHFGIAEIAGGGITRPAECDGTNVTFLA
jgi:hypothetical protein